MVGPPGPLYLRWLVIADGRTEEEDLEGQEPQPARVELGPAYAATQRLSAVPPGQAAARGVPDLWLVQRPPGNRDRLIE